MMSPAPQSQSPANNDATAEFSADNSQNNSGGVAVPQSKPVAVTPQSTAPNQSFDQSDAPSLSPSPTSPTTPSPTSSQSEAEPDAQEDNGTALPNATTIESPDGESASQSSSTPSPDVEQAPPASNTQTQPDEAVAPSSLEAVAEDLDAQLETEMGEEQNAPDTGDVAAEDSTPEPTVEPTANTEPSTEAAELEPEMLTEANDDVHVPELAHDVDVSGAESVLDVLQKQNIISPEHAQQVRQEHVSSGKAIETVLLDRKLATQQQLVQAKALFYDVPYVDLDEIGVSPEALNVLPESVARRYSMLPFAFNKQERELRVAMANPLDLSAIDFASQKTGYHIDPYFALKSQIERTIAERYAQTLSSEVNQALEETPESAQQQQANFSALQGDVVRQAPITKIVETIVSYATKSRASDVHIEPQENRTRIRYRIDGILQEKLILPRNVHDAVVSRIKILSGLKIDEKRVPQDGRFSFEADGQDLDLRVSTLPTIHGEKVVMRLLKKDQDVPSLPELGLDGLALKELKEAVEVPHGIILVTGPTGSGKTTTLYSVLHKINTPKVNIMTLEDPVEYQMPGVNQVQVNRQAGLNFASGLRSFLRQDPNIVMVGEIRDSETVELAVQASLTGHLVFSTLHTSSAAGAVPRMMDMGAEPFLLASSLTLAMGQRIVRRIHPEYKESYKPEPAVLADIKNVLGDHFDRWCKKNDCKEEDIVLYRPKEDRPATTPAFKGRVGIFEVMPITEEISNLILEQKPASQLEKVAIKNGMKLMKQDGYLKALNGLTTIEEVLRVAQI